MVSIVIEGLCLLLNGCIDIYLHFMHYIKLQLDANSKKSDLLKAMNNHFIAKCELIGKYQRKHRS